MPEMRMGAALTPGGGGGTREGPAPGVEVVAGVDDGDGEAEAGDEVGSFGVAEDAADAAPRSVAASDWDIAGSAIVAERVEEWRGVGCEIASLMEVSECVT